MNESLIICQSLLVASFALFCLRLGKAALMSFISVVFLFANVFVLKQIDFLFFIITCSDAFTIGTVIGLNLLQEYYGKDAAKKAIDYSFIFGLFFLLISQIHLFFVPSVVDITHQSYVVLFYHTPRIIISSYIVFYFVQKIDIKLFSMIKNRFRTLPLAIRVFMSVFFSQLLDTVLFSFLALYGLVASIFDIIIVSFCIKLLIMALSSSVISFSKYWVKKDASV